MFAKLNAVLVTYYSTGSVRQFFLKDEVLLNLNPLSDRRSLDLGTCGALASKFYWLFIDGDRYGAIPVITVLVRVFVIRALVCFLLFDAFHIFRRFHGSFSLLVRLSNC